jgi:DNA-binding transcriptional MerR regulator
MTEAHYTVSEVARLAHVSVRTLHHYDEIGLLSPARRTAAGYRLYAESDVRRLHEILLFRELGLALDAIERILRQPDVERAAALRAHRGELGERLRRTHAVMRAVDAKLAELERGADMSTEERFEGFDDFDHAQYAEEAEQRWGDTEAYRESARRTKHYTKDDWAAIRAEADGVMERWSMLLAAGAAPESAEAMDAAEQHRAHIARWFYPCSHEFHEGLAAMFGADARFGESFEKHGAGMTAFVAASIRANAARAAAGGTAVGRGTRNTG